MMEAKDQRLEPPDLSHYEENRSKFPLEDLAKYWRKHVAFGPDGSRIVASGDSLDLMIDDKPVEISSILERRKPLTQEPIDRVRYYIPKDLHGEAKKLRAEWTGSP